jgi:predicted transcriptional regulator
MTPTEGFKKRKYSLKMQDTYNELLRLCHNRKTIRELGLILNKTNTHVINFVNTLAANGHVKKVVISEKTGLIEVVALSDYVPENEFAQESRPRSRKTAEEIQKYQWAGNPYRQTIV